VSRFLPMCRSQLSRRALVRSRWRVVLIPYFRSCIS
jgi:hypothetical protein